MGCIIIFETKFVKLSDGRFLHFERSGCNNDSHGRSKWDFGAELCTFEDVVTEINHWKTNYKPYKECNSMDLKQKMLMSKTRMNWLSSLKLTKLWIFTSKNVSNSNGRNQKWLLV